MKCLKKILYSFVLLISSLFAEIDSDGWVTLSRPLQRHFEDQGEEDDPSLWVVFSKIYDEKKFLVRFPEDPEYTELKGDVLKVAAKTETGDYILRVAKEDFEEATKLRLEGLSEDPQCLLIQVERPGSNILDILYRSEGKWIRERIQKSAEQLYMFQTVSETFESSGHKQFVESLHVEWL